MHIVSSFLYVNICFMFSLFWLYQLAKFDPRSMRRQFKFNMVQKVTRIRGIFFIWYGRTSCGFMFTSLHVAWALFHLFWWKSSCASNDWHSRVSDYTPKLIRYFWYLCYLTYFAKEVFHVINTEQCLVF